jgi:hypothetical protein
MDCIPQTELTMAIDPDNLELDAERMYLQTRLANLEKLLCELLVKNEQLRQERQVFAPLRSDDRTALTEL